MRGEWFVTGDRYLVDADGFYHFRGRSDDMLRVGGKWLAPQEVENALAHHPAVADCALVGLLDKDALVSPCAYVVLKPGASASVELAGEIQRFVKERIAAYKYPRHIRFIDRIPRTAGGNIEVMYDDVILVLKGLSLEVAEGRIVALLGANGAGKTTTLKAISGILKVENGEVTDGSIEFMGQRIDGRDPEEIVRMGIFQVMEGRCVFENLTVHENLIAATCTRRQRGEINERYEMVFHYFPALKPLRHRLAGYLSGGEQQMLVIGRALMARTRLMMLDEPSLGLSPLLVGEIFSILKRLNQEQKMTMLLVEQNARLALSIAEHGYVMENGKIVLDDRVDKLKDNEDIKMFYLGLTEMGAKRSYRDLKFYKRRKRWLT
jgi:branched-chain amino acid transport system ATP-binding protein